MFGKVPGVNSLDFPWGADGGRWAVFAAAAGLTVILV